VASCVPVQPLRWHREAKIPQVSAAARLYWGLLRTSLAVWGKRALGRATTFALLTSLDDESPLVDALLGWSKSLAAAEIQSRSSLRLTKPS
jgi:hypothetical protein